MAAILSRGRWVKEFEFILVDQTTSFKMSEEISWDVTSHKIFSDISNNQGFYSLRRRHRIGILIINLRWSDDGLILVNRGPEVKALWRLMYLRTRDSVSPPTLTVSPRSTQYAYVSEDNNCVTRRNVLEGQAQSTPMAPLALKHTHAQAHWKGLRKDSAVPL